jgi:diguanylate cyclase (GGDEF)-like protein
VKARNRRIVPGLVVLGLGFAAFYCGGPFRSVGVPFAFILASLWIVANHRAARLPHIPVRPAGEAGSGQSLPQNITKEVSKETAETAEGGMEALGAHYRKEEWRRVETVVDNLLDSFITIMQQRFSAHTVAILFPTEDNGYRIRRYSSKCTYVNDQAIIYPGVGVIGSFLKDGLKKLNLQEIVSDSMTLYYYNQDAGIRSLIASPLIVGDVNRGTIIVDSTEVRHFSDQDQDYLGTMAGLVGQTVYFAYLSTEYRLEHRRIVSMSSIEKDFFNDLSVDAILDSMAKIIPFAISCDRLTISLIEPDTTEAAMQRVWGHLADTFKNLAFSTSDKSLAAIVYSKNICLCRNFVEDHYETRYTKEEQQSSEFSSFLAVPIGVDKCVGAFFLEAFRKNAFTESNRDLLLRLATSAGLAIERLRIIEQAKSLATHDGLTGLINHREFQALLKDELSRALRYGDPVSLVLCDIDFFKKVNDTYGHPFGDTVLKGIAGKLRENLRDGVDAVARYGGEEFALILVKTDAEKAVETVERIRQEIEKFHFKNPRGQDIHVTMSFGIAVYLQHAKQIDVLVQKADKALYRAKENGRNRVELF